MSGSKITTQLMAGFAATMSLAGAGFEFGWPAPSLPRLLAPDSSIPITSDEGSWVVSVFTIGCAFGSFIGAVLVDTWGRKWLLLVTMIPYLIASILMAAAQNVWWLLIARVTAGLGTGIGFTVVPMYAGEIADDRIRGAMSGMLSPVVNVSVVITYCIGPWVSQTTLAGLGGTLPLIFGMMFIWMPESPYFLMMRGKRDEAEESLIWLRGTDNVKAELKMIQENVESVQQNSGSIKELVTIPGNRKALLIVSGLMLAQQFSGVSAILAYCSLIFRASGSPLDSRICVIVIGLCQIIVGTLIIFIVDLVGRRILLLISTCGSIFFLAGMALYFQSQSSGTDVSLISWLPVSAIIGFVLIFSIGLGTLPYVVLSEILPCNVKALTTMFANITGSLSAVVTTKLYQTVADDYGIHTSFWGFAVITVFSSIFIYLIVPETKRRSFQDIQKDLNQTRDFNIVSKRFEV